MLTPGAPRFPTIRASTDPWVLVIYGSTGAGKTTLAKAVAAVPALQEHSPEVVTASGWLAERYPELYEHAATLPPSERADLLTNLSAAHLNAHPNAAAEWICGQVKTCRPVIVEGLRNPMDLAAILNFRQVLAVRTAILTRPSSPWEWAGVEAIAGMVDFAVYTQRAVRYAYNTPRPDPEALAAAFLKLWEG